MSAERAGSARKQRKRPETLRLRAVEPSLTVADLQTSIAWYRDILGFTLDDTWGQDGKVLGAQLKAGNARLALTQDDWAKGRDRVKGEGIRLYLTTAQDVDDVATRIRAAGGTLASQPQDMPWGVRAFNILDPDGFKLTISSAD